MADANNRTLVIPEMITVGELATQLNLPVTKLIGELFKNGIMATVNQRIDFETAQIITEELSLGVTLQKKEAESVLAARASAQRAKSENASDRPPIVAVMGHVDHGKTSLLDAILDLKVVSGEAGGITQHISAYQAIRKNRAITLLDTPGHEAFSALRQHGAALTDVVIIVVAADDGVKPQTVEAIKFAQAAHAKMVVAITKVDKETADIPRVKAELAEHGLQTEEWGGDTVMVEVSAKTGQNIDRLLDLVLLVADLEELKAETDGPAEGLVIESNTVLGRGSVVRLLVEHGILRSGAYLVAGKAYGKIRTLEDYAGRPLKEAGPSTPAIVTGFKELPQFGDRFDVVKNEKEARLRAAANAADARESVTSSLSSTDLLGMMNRQAETVVLNAIVRADVQGSLTSVLDSLRLIEQKDAVIRIVSSGVGHISENDVRRAAGSGAVIYGFNVQLPPAVKKVAAREKVEVRLYRVIYELLDDARTSLEDLLAPEVVETEVGSLEIKGVFKITKEEAVVGGEVTEGKAVPKTLARVIRGGSQLAEVSVVNVQRNKQDAREVFQGDLCGLNLKTQGKLQIEIGDRLEFFTRELRKRTLSGK
ncbi:translation initiation factor IF-2 [Candidatus Saccharibacteria bacterium]|nr:translation initiation factor IF-2 [Candidatus Saccharibacteria bacterium]